ncbi:hypothetical protein GBAR_LOCUS20721 [Geodia barretti]|nr:hypothetical protein GBAR_LOCUS20721 [Geodia barretti]
MRFVGIKSCSTFGERHLSSLRPTMKLLVVGLALCALSWGHNLPNQEYQPGGQSYYTQDIPDTQDYVQGDMQDGEFLGEDGGDSYQQQDKFDGGDMDEGMGEQQQEDALLSSEDGAIPDEEEGRRVYLMHLGTEVEEQIAGEFYEAPGDSFVKMEEVPPEDDEDMGGPTEQHHHKFKIGKRSADDDTLSELEVFLQQKEEEGDKGVGYGGSVTVQWNNKLHEPMSVTCGAGFALYHMRSVFNAGAQDRQFLFGCKRVAPLCMPGNNYDPAKRVCKWYKMNNIATTGQYHCPGNYYLAGVQSKATCKHDRE